jgi:hypothetical protein
VAFQGQIDMIFVGDAEHPGHPLAGRTDEYLDQVQEINLKQRRITICEVANMLGILF